jgi:hypothetical protein
VNTFTFVKIGGHGLHREIRNAYRILVGRLKRRVFLGYMGR